MKSIGVILVCVFLTSFQSLANRLRIIEQVEKEFRVKVVLNSGFKDTWKSVSYDEVDDNIRIENYLKLLLFEYKKYPLGYLNKANVDIIVICDSLKFKGQKRAAIPDPYKKVLYFSINSNYTKNYLIHVMHHELHHSTEYFLYGSMNYKWEKWNKKNIKRFSYGKGGITAYENTDNDYYSITHPKKGFSNLYSTLEEEEDRCEIVAFLMNKYEKKSFLRLLKDDKILTKKVKLIIKEMNLVTGVDFIKWKDVKKQIKKLPI